MICLYSTPYLTYIYVSDSLGSNGAALTPASIHMDSLGDSGSLFFSDLTKGPLCVVSGATFTYYPLSLSSFHTALLLCLRIA